jgi:hypothetical protein
MRRKVPFQSKQILSAPGYISLFISFRLKEIKRKKAFYGPGKSKTTLNVKANKNKIVNHAIKDVVNRLFPPPTSGSGNFLYTPYDIIIMSYEIVYYASRYQIIEKKNKKGQSIYYERFRDTELKRTRYSKISPSKEYSPEQEWYD